MLLAGCDVLDTSPYDKFSEDLVWESRSNADAFVFGTYDAVVKAMCTDFVGEEAWTNNNIDIRGKNETREQITRDNDFGFNKFSQIRRCNLIIQKASESMTLSETDKKELIAEGKFLRAMAYFWLAKRFGIVVWVDRVLTANEETFQLPTTPDAATTYNYILQDLQDAVEGMPETALPGRASKYAAYALMSEVCLQAAAYTENVALYQQAIDAADKIINSNQFTMDPDYEGMFNEKNRYSKEIILATYRLKSNTTCEGTEMQQTTPNADNSKLAKTDATPVFVGTSPFQGWLYYSPSQNLVNEYLVIDQLTGKAVRWDESSQFKANVTKIPPTTDEIVDAGSVTTDIRLNELIYADRDKRFYGTFIYDSCVWYGQTITTCIQGNLYRHVGDELGGHVGLTNYYWKKGAYTVTPYVFYNTPTEYHWVIFRLGRVYLNKAEALLRQNKINEAVEMLNKTRMIHGGLPQSEASTPQDAWIDYMRERRVDLAKEGDYYWSLLRWGKYGGLSNGGLSPGSGIIELETLPTHIDIAKDRKSYVIEEITFNMNNVRIFDASRRYLLPIQNSQRVRNPNLGQNPNW
jgi:tetratricopeptide (TPR) repeat protein